MVNVVIKSQHPGTRVKNISLFNDKGNQSESGRGIIVVSEL